MALAVGCYELTRRFPKEEMYGMTSQLRRASVSVAANIAEGRGRESTKMFIAFLRIAQGSLKEVETHLLISQRVKLADTEQSTTLLVAADEIGRILRALIRSLQKRDPGEVGDG
jgi:four helix bundle protein